MLQTQEKQVENGVEAEFLDFEVKELDIKKEVGTGPIMADMQASAQSIVFLLVF
jgi:hypothetical protein